MMRVITVDHGPTYFVIAEKKVNDYVDLLLCRDSDKQIIIAHGFNETSSVWCHGDYYGYGTEALLEALVCFMDAPLLTEKKVVQHLLDFFEDRPETRDEFKELTGLPDYAFERADSKFIKAMARQYMRYVDLDAAENIYDYADECLPAEMDVDLLAYAGLDEHGQKVKPKNAICFKDEDGGIGIAGLDGNTRSILLATGLVPCEPENYIDNGSIVEVFRPKDSILAKSAQVIKEIDEATYDYPSDNIDVVKDEASGNLHIMYHSSNNSFAVKENIAASCDVDLKYIEKMLDQRNMGHVW